MSRFIRYAHYGRCADDHEISGSPRGTGRYRPLGRAALKPFGLGGMSAFALIQINFVSFAAPLATLAIMDKRGVSDRQMAATLAMVFAMGQGNVFYPLTPLDCTGWPRFAFRLSAVCARGGHLARHRAPSVSDRECPGGGATNARNKTATWRDCGH